MGVGELIIAIVGSRACSAEEQQVAEKLGLTLARRGVVVLSGLARGIDTAALTGVARGGGRAVVVLSTASGEEVYPRSNRNLARQLHLLGGVVVTPFAEPSRDTYVLRRRLIERNFLMALYCDVGIVVQDDPCITGGTAWMVAFCQQLQRPLLRLSSFGGLHLALPSVERRIWWEPELPELSRHIFRPMV